MMNTFKTQELRSMSTSYFKNKIKFIQNTYIFWLLFLLLIIFGLLHQQLPLIPDEAYYWIWSNHLALSYYDHPPMVAYLISLSCLIYHSEFFVRGALLVTWPVTIVTTYALAKKMFDLETAKIGILLMISSPLICAFALIITPDSPLFMFWMLTLYCFYLGVFEKKPWILYLAGIFAGCALLSKYMAVLLFPALLSFLLFSPQHRIILFQKDIYIAFGRVIVRSGV